MAKIPKTAAGLVIQQLILCPQFLLIFISSTQIFWVWGFSSYGYYWKWFLKLHLVKEHIILVGTLEPQLPGRFIGVAIKSLITHVLQIL